MKLIMATTLHRAASHGRFLRSLWRPFSSDALVEATTCEIGTVSGIPEEHLRRKVFYSMSQLTFGFCSACSCDSNNVESIITNSDIDQV